MRTQVRQIGQFHAVGQSGRRYLVIEWQEFHEVTSIGNPVEWVPGLRSLALPDGRAVNLHGDGSLEVVVTGERLTRE